MRAILTFHSIDDTGSVISYRPAHFSGLLSSLADKRIPVYDLGTLLRKRGAPGVAITFDDGMRSVYDNALPVLREHQAPAHLFLTTGAIEAGEPWPRQPAGIPSFDMLDWDRLGQLQDAGILVESHTHTHPDMRNISVSRMQEECDRADELIAGRTGRRPEYFAYPYGFHNTAAREFVKGRYAGAVTTELRHLGAGDRPEVLPRIDTYYLQSDWAVRNVDSLLMTFYLRVRNRLRTLKGSQSTPDSD